MAELKGSKTEQNLRRALASESEASLRYQYFAQQADVEGQPAAAALFRSVAEGETGHAFGHLEFLAEFEDPLTGVPLDSTADSLIAAIANETIESSEMYPAFSKTAREEGFAEVAEWMDSLARAESGHVKRLQQAFDSLD